jgi:histidinol-phosphate aminotransferase
MLRGVLEILQPYEAGKTLEGERVIKLGSNENPYPPPEGVLREIRRALKRANRYPDASYRRLKERLSEYTGLPVENISVGNGASEVLDNVCKIALNPLDKVVIPVPSYTMYVFLSMLREASLEFVETEYENFRVKAEDVVAASGDAKLVFLCSPNNPTGRVVERKELVKIIEGTRALVVVDEAYYEFCGKTIADKVGEYDNLIVVRSMSKFFGLAGLRVGYALSNPRVTQMLEKVRLPFNVNTPAEAAAIKVIENLGLYKKISKEIIEERKLVAREIGQIKGLRVFPSEANFLLVRLPRAMNASELAEALLREEVVVRNVSGIPGLKNNYLRITIGKKQENRRLISVLKKLFSSC